MAEPLPGGWVDTGIKYARTYTGQVRVRMDEANQVAGAVFAYGRQQEYTLIPEFYQEPSGTDPG